MAKVRLREALRLEFEKNSFLLQKADGTHHVKGVIWLVVTVLINSVSYFFIALMLNLAGKDFPWTDLVLHGELLIICTALMYPTVDKILSAGDEYEEARGTVPRWPIYLLFTLELFLGGVFYHVKLNNPHLTYLLVIVTLVLVVLVLALGYSATVVYAVVKNPPKQAESGEEISG